MQLSVLGLLKSVAGTGSRKERNKDYFHFQEKSVSSF